MDKKGTSGVGFAVAKRLMENIIEPPKAISDRLMKMRICIQADNNALAIVFSVPCQRRTNLLFSETSTRASAAIMRLGTECWEGLDEATAMLMENFFSLCVQTLTSQSPTATSVYPTSGFYTWQHPRSKRWHLLDYVLTRRSNLPDICITRAVRGADCSTDRHLIRCILKMDGHVTLRHQAVKPKRRLNVAKLHTTTGRADLRRPVELIYDDR